MTDFPENQVNTEAPATGASASVPEIKVTPGGKSRPSVAGAKRARVVIPQVEKREEGLPHVAVQGEASGAASTEEGQVIQDSLEAEGTEAPSVEVPSTFDTAEDVRARASVRERKPLSRGAKIAISICCVIMVLVCAFSMVRWVLPQDGSDIQGTWAMDGAKNSIVIANGQIDLAGQAAYDYSLDTNAKTIQVEFFTKGGSAHYRFSSDRQSLAIIESDDLSWTSTLFNDLAWSWYDFIAMVQENPRDPLGYDKGIILVKQ